MYRPLYWFGTGSQPDAQPVALARPAARLRQGRRDDRHGPPEALQVVERRDGDRPGRRVLDEHGRRPRSRTGRATPGDDARRPQVGHRDRSEHARVHDDRTGEPLWFTYNELSQITPLPMAWDVSKSGAEGRQRGVREGQLCLGDARRRQVEVGDDVRAGLGGSAKSCAAVWTYLSQRVGLRPGQPEGAEQLAEHLRHEPALAGRRRPVASERVRSSGGTATMVPNKSYSGPVKPHARQVHRAAVHDRPPPSSTHSSAAS